MTLNRRTLLKTSIAAAAPGALWTRARAAGVADRELVLGTHLDLSGPVAIAMPVIRNGIQMRIDEANEAGGIHGRKLRLVIEDNASQPSQAVRAVDKLIRRDEVFALLCPFGSGPNVATVKKAVDAGVICFAPYAASALVRQAAGQTPLLFTTNLNYDSTTSAAVRWATGNLGTKKVGLVYQEGPFGDLVGKGVKAALASKGMPLAAEASYKVGDLDFSSHVARMQAAGVDLIVCATTTRNDRRRGRSQEARLGRRQRADRQPGSRRPDDRTGKGSDGGRLWRRHVAHRHARPGQRDGKGVGRKLPQALQGRAG